MTAAADIEGVTFTANLDVKPGFITGAMFTPNDSHLLELPVPDGCEGTEEEALIAFVGFVHFAVMQVMEDNVGEEGIGEDLRSFLFKLGLAGIALSWDSPWGPLRRWLSPHASQMETIGRKFHPGRP